VVLNLLLIGPVVRSTRFWLIANTINLVVS
jgi:hypothetical protein